MNYASQNFISIITITNSHNRLYYYSVTQIIHQLRKYSKHINRVIIIYRQNTLFGPLIFKSSGVVPYIFKQCHLSHFRLIFTNSINFSRVAFDVTNVCTCGIDVVHLYHQSHQKYKKISKKLSSFWIQTQPILYCRARLNTTKLFHIWCFNLKTENIFTFTYNHIKFYTK